MIDADWLHDVIAQELQGFMQSEPFRSKVIQIIERNFKNLQPVAEQAPVPYPLGAEDVTTEMINAGVDAYERWFEGPSARRWFEGPSARYTTMVADVYRAMRAARSPEPAQTSEPFKYFVDVDVRFPVDEIESVFMNHEGVLLALERVSRAEFPRRLDMARRHPFQSRHPSVWTVATLPTGYPVVRIGPVPSPDYKPILEFRRKKSAQENRDA